tara:strand:+ start:351 stop:761 length:411 start_codon:yes stop_codon:yes gene_type:complete
MSFKISKLQITLHKHDKDKQTMIANIEKLKLDKNLIEEGYRQIETIKGLQELKIKFNRSKNKGFDLLKTFLQNNYDKRKQKKLQKLAKKCKVKEICKPIDSSQIINSDEEENSEADIIAWKNENSNRESWDDSDNE